MQLRLAERVTADTDCGSPSSVSASRCHLPPRGKALVRFFDHTAYQRDVEDAVPYRVGA